MTSVFYSQIPLDENFEAKYKSTNEIWMMIFQVCVLFYSIIFASQKYILGIICTLFPLFLYYDNFLHIRFYYEKAEQIYRTYLALVIWISFSYFMRNILNMSYLVSFVSMTPFLIAYSVNNFLGRFSEIGDIFDKTNTQSVMGHIMWVLKLVKCSQRSHEVIRRGYIYTFIHDFKGIEENLEAKSIEELDIKIRKLSLNQIKDILIKFCENKLNIVLSLNSLNHNLRLFISYFLYFNVSKEKGIAHLTFLENSNLNFEVKFHSSIFRNLVNKDLMKMRQNSENNFSLMKMVEYENIQKKFFTTTDNSALYHMNLWGILKEESPACSKISKFGMQVLKSRNLVEDLWEKLQKLIPDKTDTSLHYSKYCLNIVWDTNLAQETIERAQQAIQNHNFLSINYIEKSFNFEALDQPLVQICSEGLEIGKINQINNAASREFGFLKEDAIGLSLKILIPKIFQIEHLKLLESYSEQSKLKQRKFDKIENYVPCINKMNYLIPSFKNVISFPSIVNGKNYLAKFTIDKDVYNPNIVIVLTNEKFEIQNISTQAISWLNISQEMIEIKKIDLSDMIDILKNCETLKELIKKENENEEGIQCSINLPFQKSFQNSLKDNFSYNSEYSISMPSKLLSNSSIQAYEILLSINLVTCKKFQNKLYVFKIQFRHKKAQKTPIIQLNINNEIPILEPLETFEFNEKNLKFEKTSQIPNQFNPIKPFKKTENIIHNAEIKEINKDENVVAIPESNMNEKIIVNSKVSGFLGRNTQILKQLVNKLKTKDNEASESIKLLNKNPIDFSLIGEKAIITWRFNHSTSTFSQINDQGPEKEIEKEIQLVPNLELMQKREKKKEDKKFAISFQQNRKICNEKLEHVGNSLKIKFIFFVSLLAFIVSIVFSILISSIYSNFISFPRSVNLQINKISSIVSNFIYSYTLINPFYNNYTLMVSSNENIISEIFQINDENLKILKELSQEFDPSLCGTFRLIQGNLNSIPFDFLAELYQIQTMIVNFAINIKQNPDYYELGYIMNLIINEVSIKGKCYRDKLNLNIQNVFENDKLHNSLNIFLSVCLFILVIICGLILYSLNSNIVKVISLMMDFSPKCYSILYEFCDDYIKHKNSQKNSINDYLEDDNLRLNFENNVFSDQEIRSPKARKLIGEFISKTLIGVILIVLVIIFESFCLFFLLTEKSFNNDIHNILKVSSNLSEFESIYGLTISFLEASIINKNVFYLNRDPIQNFLGSIDEAKNKIKLYESILLSSSYFSQIKELFSVDVCSHKSTCFKSSKECYSILIESKRPNIIFLLSSAFNVAYINLQLWASDPSNSTLFQGIYNNGNATLRCLLKPEIQYQQANYLTLLESTHNTLISILFALNSLYISIIIIIGIVTLTWSIRKIYSIYFNNHLIIGILPLFLLNKSEKIRSFLKENAK